MVIFGETHFRRKVYTTVFPEFEQKIVKRPAKLFRWTCQNCFLRIQMNNVSVYFFLKKVSAHCFSGCWVKNFRSFKNNFSAGLWKLLFLCPEYCFREKIFLWNLQKFYSYSGYELNIFGVWAKSFQRGCKNCILQVRG